MANTFIKIPLDEAEISIGSVTVLNLPASLGQGLAANSLSVVLASDQPAIPVTFSGGTIDQGDAGLIGEAWWIRPTDGVNSQLYTVSGEAKVSLTTSLPAGSNAIGSVSVSNFPGTQPVSGTVAVSNFPATQPISAVALPLPSGASTEGTLATLSGKVPSGLTVASTRLLVDGSGATQPVSGPLTDTQLRASPVPISGSTTVSGTVAATQSGTWNVNAQGASAVGAVPTENPVLMAAVASDTGEKVIPQTLHVQGVNAIAVYNTSEPTGGPTVVDFINGNGQSLNTPSDQINCQVAYFDISGTWAGTLAFKVAEGSNVVALPARNVGTGTVGTTTTSNGLFVIEGVDPTNVFIQSTAWSSGQANLTISASPAVTGEYAYQAGAWSVTANAGTNLNTSALALDATLTGGTQTTRVTDGTNTAAVKAASTAAGAADKALVVAISPNNSVAVTGSVTATQATGTNLHTVVDSGSIVVTQGTAANLNATVTGTVTANAGTGPFPVAGMVASAGANANNPVKIGGVFNTTQPTVTNGQIVDAQTTARGAQIVATGADTFNVTINAALPAGSAALGSVSVSNASGASAVNIQDGGNSITVDGTVGATQSGTWTVQPGNTANTTPWLASVNDGTNTAAVKAASTAAAATDKALVVAVSPNNTVPTNVTQFGSNNVATGTGAGGNGVPRVTVSNDSQVKLWDATTAVGVIAATTALKTDMSSVAGTATVNSVAGIQDIMPRKRTGATGLSPNYSASRITSKTTTTPTAATAYVSALVISCSAAGTSWTMVVQNKEGTPKILVPSFTLTVPTTGLPVILQFEEPILMTGGIDIITGGTTAGTVDVYVTYWQ